jgi:hypothetical protein
MYLAVEALRNNFLEARLDIAEWFSLKNVDTAFWDRFLESRLRIHVGYALNKISNVDIQPKLIAKVHPINFQQIKRGTCLVNF